MSIIHKKNFLILITIVFCMLFNTLNLVAQEDIRESFQKLQLVFSELPDDALAAIPNGEPVEFLADLQKVLDADTDNLLIFVDKKHLISSTYKADDIIPLEKNSLYRLNKTGLSLRKPAEAALAEMSRQALSDGVSLLVSSTYRSYEYQKNLYERNVAELGKEVADRESAAPGSSQHQLGTAIDFGSITDDFATTKAGKWLTTNAWKYGYSLSFPDGYENVTGFRWECWHYRYIGKEAAAFQRKWFSDVQQYMIMFVDAWKNQR